MTDDNKLKELRQAKHLSQAELAKMVGVSYQLIQRWENGSSLLRYATYYNLMRLSNALDVEAKDLVKDEEWQDHDEHQ